jgi:cytochrome c oxidase subunit 1
MGASYLLVPRLLRRRLELEPMARVQPYLWFIGMICFSVPTHITGLMGMPRRVFNASYGDHPVAQSWIWLTDISAVGGMVLFASAAFYLLVITFTIFGPRADAAGLEFADSVEPEPPGASPLDRLGLLTAVAAVLIAIAYGYPIWQHLLMPRFGSPGFSPF